MTDSAQFAKGMKGVLRILEVMDPCASGVEARMGMTSAGNTTMDFYSNGGHTHSYPLSVHGDSHTHPLGAPSGKRWSMWRMGAPIGPSWECPYCGADHELTVKTCDCCGARRRQEYVH